MRKVIDLEGGLPPPTTQKIMVWKNLAPCATVRLE
jgi:hypothetical protein